MLEESNRLPEPAATPNSFGQNGGRLHPESVAGIEWNMQVPIHLSQRFRYLVSHGNDLVPTEQVSLEAQLSGYLVHTPIVSPAIFGTVFLDE